MRNAVRTPIQALKPKTLLYQAAQEEIKNYILQNNLKPGDSLPPETEFVTMLGVSRTSVREAVKSLETLGILEARPGAGLFVKSFSFDPLIDNLAYGLMFNIHELSEILEVRFHIENGMIERAVELVTPEQLDKLKAILRKMKADADRKIYSSEDDRLFHQVLWENVNNSMLQKILDIFWSCFYQARKRADIPEPPDLIDTYARHLAIVTAMEKRDLAAARESMMHHNIGIQSRLKKLYEVQSADDSVTGPMRAAARSRS